MVDKKISLAIPTFNSSGYIQKTLELPLKDDRISEIVISDDASSDFDALRKNTMYDKVRLFRNTENFGGFVNKFKTISYCQNDWAILFDSDNQLVPEYVDALYRLDKWEHGVIYCALRASRRMYYGPFLGIRISRMNIGRLIKEQPILTRMFLNTGNYFVNRDAYLKINRYGQDHHTPCAITFTYLWLKSGGQMQVVEGMKYNHKMAKSGYWNRNKQTMQPIVERIINDLCQG